MTTSVPLIGFNNGVEIPQLGFGVFQIEPEQTKQAVLTALEVGYRHIDTAEMYGNEREVGEAVRESGIDRGEIFVTSKLNNGAHDPQAAADAFQRTLEALDIGALDLFLMHWPMPGGGYVDTWRAMERMYEGASLRSIGVSNFKEHHLNRLFAETTVVPATNQIEIHPYLAQDDLRAFHRQHGITTEAWSPIAQGKVLGDPVLERIARAHGVSTAQVTLRWHIQRGDIVFPKSVTRERVEANFDIFDFELSDADMGDIGALDRGERTGPDPDTFDYVPS